jgi:M6 family metalloprotease-like protein
VNRPRRRLAIALAWAAALSTAAAPVHAITADPQPARIRQPDGATVMLRLIGDEHYHWWQDLEGYPVVQVGDDFRYATHDRDGELVATGWRAGEVQPASVGLSPGHRPGPAARARLAQVRFQQLHPAQAVTPPNGTVKNLVILAQFHDHSGAMTRGPTEIETVMNALGGNPTLCPSGSVRDVWRENSYGNLDLVSTVQNWVLLPNDETWYAADTTSGFNQVRRDSMVTDALNLADVTTNFANFDQNNDGYVDAIDIIHSGYGAEAANSKTSSRIWSQQWSLATDWVSNDRNANGDFVKVSRVHTEPALWGTSGTDIVRIGVIAHETGHFFGLPDLYDYDSDGQGAGLWCLMGDSWGWTQTQRFPPNLCAWSKIRLGYITPIDVTGPGAFTLAKAETTTQVLKVSAGFGTNEYLLIEHREPVRFDREMPNGGIAIWHIDDNLPGNPGDRGNSNQGFPGQPGWPTNGLHYLCALLQADGRYDLEKLPWVGNPHGDATDLWRASDNAILNESTVPSSDAYAGGSAVPTGVDVRVTSNPGATMTLWVRPGVWVDPSAVGPQIGAFTFPYHSVGAAVAAVGTVPDNSGIVCKTGTYAEHPAISRPLMIRTWNGSTILGRP